MTKNNEPRSEVNWPGHETGKLSGEESKRFDVKPQELLAAALRYAASGKPVFPCGPDKKPHTAHGFKDGSHDPEQIKAWWRQWPDAMLAIPTGEASGVFVLDVDCKDGAMGFESLADLETSHSALPATLTARTRSGGRHLYFRHVPGVKNSASKLGPGLDVRGSGGYVAVPPSPGYTWDNEGTPIADAPAWLIDLLTKPKASAQQRQGQPQRAYTGNALPYGKSALAGIISEMKAAPQGSRNSTLNEQAFKLGQLVAGGELMVSAGEELKAAAISAGLEFGEVEKTFSSGFERGTQEPRSKPKRERSEKTGQARSSSGQPPHTGQPPSADEGQSVHADAEIERLAGLDALRYGQERKAAAVSLGVAVTYLDAAVSEKRRQTKNQEPPPDDASEPPAEDAGRPIIQHIDARLPEICGQALKHLRGRVYQRSGLLFRLGKTIDAPAIHGVKRAEGATVLIPAGVNWLIKDLTEIICWRRYDGRKRKVVDTSCPPQVAATIVALEGEYRDTRPLKSIIHAPLIRQDGSILDQPGYDEQTALFLAGNEIRLDIPKNPTRDDAIAALASLDELISAFPFVDAASKSVAVAAIITGLQRPALPTAPMFCFSAPVAGSGKSLLAEVVAAVSTGQSPAFVSYKGEEEFAKTAMALLWQNTPAACIDNVNGILASDWLCTTLTQTMKTDRVLGQSRNVVSPTCCLWMATGNNIEIRGDLVRRSLMCRIDPQSDRPQDRDFSFNPVSRAKENRGCYISAALTIVRAYIAAGCPEQKLRSFGSFNEWSLGIRAALVWAGMTDPVATQARIEVVDTRRLAEENLAAAWHDEFASRPTTVKSAILVERVNAAFAEIIGDKHGEFSLKSAGRVLARLEDRRFSNGLLFKRDAKGGDGLRWMVLKADYFTDFADPFPSNAGKCQLGGYIANKGKDKIDIYTQNDIFGYGLKMCPQSSLSHSASNDIVEGEL